MESLKGMSIPTLGEDNYEKWRQNLLLVASALAADQFLVKNIDGTQLKGDDRKHFYLLANIILSSLSERPRAIATGAGTVADLTPYAMYERLQKLYMPISTFNDLSYR